MASVADVKRMTLEELGVLRIGQTFQTQDSTSMQESYDQIYASLKEDGLAVWPSTGTVPDKVVPHLISLMAFNKTSAYLISKARYERIALKASGAIKGIKALVAPPYESLEEPVDY